MKWVRRVTFLVVPAAILFLLLLAFVPLTPKYELTKMPPENDYNLAARNAREWISREPPEVGPACRRSVRLHDTKPENVIVLLHGLTNCPAQFDPFAGLLFESGANVIVPRTPHHGFSDRMTGAHANLTADELLQSANEAVDLAVSLGRHVTVVGLSVNATAAAWMAQNRSDVRHVMLIAPFFLPRGIPTGLGGPVGRLLARLPNFFLWWNPAQKENLEGSPNAYPRFSSRAVGQVMILGDEVFALARIAAPTVSHLTVVTVGGDPAVSNARTGQLVDLWRKDRATVAAFEFPKSENVPHDAIDPDQPGARIDLVYPKLIELLESADGQRPPG